MTRIGLGLLAAGVAAAALHADPDPGYASEESIVPGRDVHFHVGTAEGDR